MAPPEIIDDIVVHECWHMRQLDHSNAFWHEVDGGMADFCARKEWQKEDGVAMNL
jgi:predicted metal-dependent hydrolase